MCTFGDDTKLYPRAGDQDDITELQEDINKLVEWESKCEIIFDIDKCSVMHIEHNNTQGNYNMSNQQFPRTEQHLDIGIINTKDIKFQKQTEKIYKTEKEYCG